MSGFKFNIDKLIKLQSILGSPDGAAQMKPLYELWGKKYLSWIRKKFLENSAGGGEWEGLADSTLAARMRKSYHTKRGRKMKQIMKAFGLRGTERAEFIGENLSVAILRNTGTLLHGLDVGAEGNLFETHAFGIKVGYNKFDSTEESERATIGQVAAYHNSGGGRLPKRQIIWPPDDDFKMFMLQSLRNHINNIGRSL